MKKILYTLLAICGMALPSGQALGRVDDVYNLQLGGSPYYYDGAAYTTTDDYEWVKLAGAQDSNVRVKLSDGTSTSIRLSYGTGGSSGSVPTSTAITSKDKELMQGYLYTDEDDAGWFSFTNLDVGEYDIYIYAQKETGVSTSLSITNANGKSGSLSNNSDLTTLQEGRNYLLLRDVVVYGDGKLNITMGFNNAINGIQLVQKSPNPEPASMVLLGVGGILVAARLMRKRSGDVSSSAVA